MENIIIHNAASGLLLDLESAFGKGNYTVLHNLVYQVMHDITRKPQILLCLTMAAPGWLGGELSDSLPGCCEFETRLKRAFFPAYFRLSSLLKHDCEKFSRRLWKERSICTGVRKPGNTCASLTAMILP